MQPIRECVASRVVQNGMSNVRGYSATYLNVRLFLRGTNLTNHVELAARYRVLAC